MITMFAPLFACALLVAAPAELNTLFLYSAGNKRAAHIHPFFGFTAGAAADSICLIVGAEGAGEAAYSYGWMVVGYSWC